MRKHILVYKGSYCERSRNDKDGGCGNVVRIIELMEKVSSFKRREKERDAEGFAGCT